MSFHTLSDSFIRTTTVCDKAIRRAIESRGGKEESEESNLKFEVAVRHLDDYESNFYPL